MKNVHFPCSWLGNKTPRRASQAVVDGNRTSVPNLAAIKTKEEEEEERKKEREKEEYEKYNFTFRSQEDKPEMVQRATRLYNLYSKRAVYAGMDQKAWDDWNRKEAEHDKELENKAAAEQPKKEGVHVPDEGLSAEEGALARAISPHRVPLRTTFTADAVQQRPRCHTMPITGTQYSRSAHPQLERGATDGGDFMKDILIRKYKRKKKKKVPLEERLQCFYDKVADLKMEETEMAADLADWENARRWKVLTKGVKAALAESSDDEDQNQIHTV